MKVSACVSASFLSIHLPNLLNFRFLLKECESELKFSAPENGKQSISGIF